jgi:hypothetical protein
VNDDDVITAVREQRDKVHSHTPVEQIISRGRTVRARRRVPGAVSGLAVVTAAAVVLGLGLSGAFGSAPARGTGTIRTAAFTLVEHANGTATLTINLRVLGDPGVLQRDLRQDGIPALVTSGSFCSSHPAPAGFSQAVSYSPYLRHLRPGDHQLPAHFFTMTFHPAAMPAGTELSFGVFQRGPDEQQGASELISTSSYSCTSTPPGPAGVVRGMWFQSGPARS